MDDDMTQGQQPESLRLADELENEFRATAYRYPAAAELRRLHHENAALQAGYDAARLEIASLHKDAERWRFVADLDNPDYAVCQWSETDRAWLLVAHPGDVDAAIAAQKGGA